ncbi:hypothetical protein [Paratissierella segnis]|jgi:hypothetical protein|uniref:Uncharacterized protein n=1 Tax=Paratissierella segnis TaxID=2763679 RepID=A0A926EUH6_9FIRM|nr:hypothetical protein [Paratissierella segnis]MBC8588740.1 hypothetical protein [Paratissierella segnis]
MYRDYPEIYYRVYPKIIQTINSHLGEDYSIDNISEDELDAMIDEVFYKTAKECPELYQDPSERKGKGRIRSAQRPFYGRGRITRDLIAIFLISELLRRNNYGQYPFNPYYYPL